MCSNPRRFGLGLPNALVTCETVPYILANIDEGQNDALVHYSKRTYVSKKATSAIRSTHLLFPQFSSGM
jgi:hypothetical protein